MAEQIPVTALKPGEQAEVVTVDTLDLISLRKLTALGILPGVTVKMVQVFPTYVLQVDYTLLALDSQIAGKIVVKK